MAITPEGKKLTELHRLLQVKLSSQAMASTRLLWGTLDPAAGSAAKDLWLKQQVQLSGIFDGKSAAAAANYVAQFRAAEGFDAGPIEGLNAFDKDVAAKSMVYHSNKMQTLIDSGVAPSAAKTAVTSGLMASAQKLAFAGGRRVADLSALANPDSQGWRRVPDGSPCAFCAMLVSRGPAYRSAKTAGQGRHWHGKCACTVEEVLGDSEWQPNAKEQKYVDAYDKAAAHLDSQGKPHTQTGILAHMRENGEFNDSPGAKVVAPNQLKVDDLKSQLKTGATTLAELEAQLKTQPFASKKADLKAAIDQHKEDMKPKPYPALGDNFRIDHNGQIWKGYNWKIKEKSGTAWKKVDSKGARINPDPPTKKQLAEAAAAKAAKEAAEAAEKAAAVAKAAHEAADAAVKAKLGQGYRLGQDGQVWKGYKYNIKGQEGVSWKKVDADGKRINVDPPTKKQVAAAEAKKQAALDAQKAADDAKAKLSEPDVILKNEYQKKTAATYGWGQDELKTWVKSGKTMQQHHLDLGKAKSPTGYVGKTFKASAPAKIAATPGQGGTDWASQHWPSASAYTAAERRGFESYTGSGYGKTNSDLRTSGGTRGKNTGLDAAFKRPTSVVPNDTVAYRGVRSARALGLNADTGDLSKLVGRDYIEHGYMSTAVEGSGFGGAINMTVKIPKGHRAVYVAHRDDALSVFGASEKELLLDRGTRFRIVEASKVTDRYGGSKWNVTVEVIPPPVHP